MKKYFLVGFLVASAALIGTAQPSYALLDLVRSDTSEQRLEDQRDPGSENGNVLNSAIQNDDSEQKRLEIQEKIDAKRAAIREKLSGHRAELCEQREAKINEALANRTAAAEQYYKKFKAIQDRLQAFVTEQGLAVENDGALGLIMADKRAHVEATIGIAQTTTFECSETSADNPGQIVKDIVAEEKKMLAEYRTAVKDFADAVKAAALAKQAGTDAVKPDETTTDESEMTETTQ